MTEKLIWSSHKFIATDCDNYITVTAYITAIICCTCNCTALYYYMWYSIDSWDMLVTRNIKQLFINCIIDCITLSGGLIWCKDKPCMTLITLKSSSPLHDFHTELKEISLSPSHAKEFTHSQVSKFLLLISCFTKYNTNHAIWSWD